MDGKMHVMVEHAGNWGEENGRQSFERGSGGSGGRLGM